MTIAPTVMAAAGPAPADPPPAAPDPKLDHFALVIGIQNYREFEPLAAAHEDATRFCRWLTDVAKVPREHVHQVIGESDGTPTNDDIFRALNNLGLRNGRRTGTRLYIYFAGHGVGPKVNEVALLPANAHINALNYQVLGAALMIDHLFKTRYFSEIVMFLDCCREAQEVTPIGLPYKLEPVSDVAPTDPPPRYCVLVGSNMDGRSFERELNGDPQAAGTVDVFRGLMTQALLDGLNGAHGAVDPVENAVTTVSLEHYVTQRVAALATEAGVQQQAVVLIRAGAPIELLKLDEVPRLTLRVKIGPISAGKLLRILNFRTNVSHVLGIGVDGAELDDFKLDTNTRHLLTNGDEVAQLLDPVTMSDPHVIVLK